MTLELGKLYSHQTQVPYSADPLSLYQHLAAEKPYSMLLESAEINTKNAIQSLILVDGAITISCMGNNIEFHFLNENGLSLLPLIEQHFNQSQQVLTADKLTVTLAQNQAILDEDARLKALGPFEALRSFIQSIDVLYPEHQSLFLGGAISYDFIETFENLPEVKDGVNPCPDYLFILAESLLKIDHQTEQAQLVTYAFGGEHYPQALSRLTLRAGELAQQITTCQPIKTLKPVTQEAEPNVSDEDFCRTVNDLKQNIVAGDVFQVVPSRAFSLPCPNPIGAYAALRLSNPSPYMFYMQADGFCIFGASPESALKYQADTNQVEVYPIAGTRIRGKDSDGNIDADLDSRIELDLRLDKKELAEHIMLVDLARNDIARISKPGSRKVAELLKVDRYSHVMHLVSRVIGQLREDLDALHAYQACMNMGTLVGAPKVRAAELVRNVEGTRRGSYGGAVGYLDGDGNMDSCIVIRSAVVADGMAHVQAGAGVVFDSIAQDEADETRNKAQAVISAIKQGGGL
ncbi:anthranilate synthase component 1 [Paraferrimonas sp. SM1919]|uniref:anthranilate synthase component 1 n=1 Tax=Paraferrimonas sp. SM1919 TaxID=2662263 RepID=UPI0013CFB18D|nr:anthranilate synthase component 1 [Paraferrimonas sp. SM1919]